MHSMMILDLSSSEFRPPAPTTAERHAAQPAEPPSPRDIRRTGSSPNQQVIDSMLQSQVNAYIDYLKRSGHKSRVTKITSEQLGYFVRWCQTQSIDSLEELTFSTATDYVIHLQDEVDLISETSIGIRTVRERTTKLRRLFEWLERENRITLRLSSSVPTIDKRGKVKLASKCTYNENLPA